MKVAFLTQPWARAFPPSESISIYNLEVACRLAAGGDEAVVYGPEQERDSPAPLGIEWRSVSTDVDWRLLRIVRPLSRLRTRLRPLFASPLHFPAYFRRVAADLRERPCDVVHLHNFPQAVPILRQALPGTAIVLHMHAEWLSLLPARRMMRLVGGADAVLGSSHYIVERARAALPDYPGTFATAWNGVDLGVFRPPDAPPVSSPRIVVVGRISPEKGIHVLLEAMEAVLDEVPEAVLTLVGKEALVPPEMLVGISDDLRVRALRRFYPGPYLERLLHKASPRVRAAVELPGHVEHAEVPGHYRRASVVVNSSLSESFGLSVVEGMASGLPVVAARTGGIPELLVDRETGLLVEPDDPRVLAAALVAVLESGELRSSFGAAGRSRAAHLFTWDRAAEAARDAYQFAGAPR